MSLPNPNADPKLAGAITNHLVDLGLSLVNTIKEFDRDTIRACAYFHSSVMDHSYHMGLGNFFGDTFSKIAGAINSGMDFYQRNKGFIDPLLK